MNQQTSTKRKAYHHGNLRNTLIVAAAELIEERGSTDFTMIEAARRAEVSSAAPYRHFKDKDALLDAVIEVAFMALTQATLDTLAEHPGVSTNRLIAIGKTYLRFVTSHPAFYDLMWGDQGMRVMSSDPTMQDSGFHLFVDAVQAWCEANALQHYNALELSVKMWAMAHGLASLAMGRHIEKWLPEADIYTLFEDSANTFLQGLRDKT